MFSITIYIISICRVWYSIGSSYAKEAISVVRVLYISNYLEPLKRVNICIIQNPYINLHFTIVKLYCGVRTKCRKDLLCVAFGLYFFYLHIYVLCDFGEHIICETIIAYCAAWHITTKFCQIIYFFTHIQLFWVQKLWNSPEASQFCLKKYLKYDLSRK